jgi:hypothetical protein
MVINYAFEYLREVIKNANGSVVAHRGVIAIHAAGNCCRVRLRLNICLRTGTKISEQPFMINPVISSSPADI